MFDSGTIRAVGPRPLPFNDMLDATIIALWRLKLDTFEIARRVDGVRESQVANRLAQLRDAGAL